MAQYHMKPVTVDADQWQEGDAPLPGMFPSQFRRGEYGIHTVVGWLHVSPEDWIIKGPEGEVGLCKPSDFEKMYEPI